jgi:single-strand DNA-binding protein
MNKAILIGRLTKEPELKLTANQKPYCNFTLAVDRKFKDAYGQRQADFINCVAWNATAQFISKYFHKGSKIAICGSIQTRTYDKNGQKQYITEVFAEEAEFVESTNQTQSSPATQNTEPADSEDLPFE